MKNFSGKQRITALTATSLMAAAMFAVYQLSAPEALGKGSVKENLVQNEPVSSRSCKAVSYCPQK